MEKHPCADGLSRSCFNVHPKYAHQAFAYKLLHVLLPKQLSKKLPGRLGKSLIGEGAIIPPGVLFPPGMTIPPEYTWPDSWTPWLYFNWPPDKIPWELFPEGWIPGDPLPEGVTINPEYVFPEGWRPGDTLPEGIKVIPGIVFPKEWRPGDTLPPGVTIDQSAIKDIISKLNPKDHPTAWLIPGYTPISPPKEIGALPPLYVQPFEPGPIKTVPPTSPIGWTQILDNTYWWYFMYGMRRTMTWDGSKWFTNAGGSSKCVNWCAIDPKLGTTWAVGYRPSKIRITFTDTTPPVAFAI